MSASPHLKEKVRTLPDKPGVYLMKDRLGRILYIGKAKALRKRVSSYFTPSRRHTHSRKIATLIEMIADFETIEVKSEPEALLLESRLIKQWKPKYNTELLDDKRFLQVRVDLTETLPRFRLTRVRQDARSRYFGPFPYSSLLRRTLAHLRREFGILLSDSTPQELPDGRWRLYDDVRQEIYGHANEVTPAEYRERVDQACAFLDGKSREWLETLTAEMQAAAAEQKFEKAAELRDAVIALQKTLEKARRFERNHPTIRPDADALASLHEALALSAPPAHMECFDISHISGTFVVASMVHFTDGRPDKARYRRFKIKSFIGNDDFRAMEEVVGRRYRRLRDEGKDLPDLIVIDGGQGQVGAAIKAFLQLDLEPPALIGLAKKHETIIFADERQPLNLSINDPGLQLLQRLRDEAHRFANTYNADLRSKRIRESLLEDMPGLGPSRQRALLDHFGSLERLRAASISELTDAPGIGPKFAVALKEFLTRHGKETEGPAK